MITVLGINNFRAWPDTGSMRLAPLMDILGINGLGKFSLRHLLTALNQTENDTDHYARATRLAARKGKENSS